MTARLDSTPDAELAKRYRWFCQNGWRYPTLNHPRVILGRATPDELDALIQIGMKRWPTIRPR